MKFVTKASLAAIALLASTPSFAQSVALHNGGDLATHIAASLANPINDAATVYGTTIAGDDNVVFTGNTAIHITDGAGFASISDAAGGADFFQLIINPEQLFSQYQFSVAFDAATMLTVEYMLNGSNVWTALAPLAQAANTNKDYQLEGNGAIFDAVRLTSTAEFNFVKQNSITTAVVNGPVPEPSTWAMLLLGFGGIGFSMRRNRKAKSSATLQAA